jgi:hypothetical protein
MYGGYYGGWDYDDDDFIVGMVVGGAVVGAAASASETTTTTTTSTTDATMAAYASLPCDPTVSVVSGVTYYQCGTTWYVQAYGATGPIFMPTAPPAGAPTTTPMPDTPGTNPAPPTP